MLPVLPLRFRSVGWQEGQSQFASMLESPGANAVGQRSWWLRPGYSRRFGRRRHSPRGRWLGKSCVNLESMMVSTGLARGGVSTKSSLSGASVKSSSAMPIGNGGSVSCAGWGERASALLPVAHAARSAARAVFIFMPTSRRLARKRCQPLGQLRYFLERRGIRQKLLWPAGHQPG